MIDYCDKITIQEKEIQEIILSEPIQLIDHMHYQDLVNQIFVTLRFCRREEADADELLKGYMNQESAF
jgi:hypothetical protein